MNDFSTTQSPDSETAVCPDCCKALMDEVMEDVNKVARVPDAVDRNVAITQRYRDLGAAMPQNDWVRLAGYVSTQGGCAMKNFYFSHKPGMATAAYTFGQAVVTPSEALETLRAANTAIFTSVYPPNKFVEQHGYEELKKCVDAKAVDVSRELMDALGKLERGEKADAANLMAEYEQMKVVQPVYEQHADTFDDMMTADAIRFWADDTSIPISYECTRDNLVPLGELDITNPEDRVRYYSRLMKRMLKLESAK